EQALTFALREDGLRLELGWKCTRSFRTAEYAALRLPLDLYQTVMSVLALPNTAGPSGLVDLPMVLQAPNHGSLQVTVVENASEHPVLARVSPLRVQAELWLDLIVGAQPLANGLFEIPAGSGRVVLDLRLNKIYPFAGTDIYTTWQRPPFYSFVDREPILGALPNAWLSGLSFRPELAMFANNSVAEAAAPCAPFYADIAAYTPDLAPGLPATAILRCVADSQLLNQGKSSYSDYDHFPEAASAPLDLAWLTVASTGDWAWAERRCAEIAHWSEILLSMEYQETGLVASKYSGRATDSEDFMSCSWWDSIRSGHIESHVDAYCYRTALRSSELLARLGQTAMAARLGAMAARAREHFMETFYDPQTRRMAQWVDVDGVRYGFDSHPHISAGIMCGLVPQDLARELLMEYLQRLQARSFASYQYGLPILLDPIPARLHNPWMGKGVEPDGSDAVGAYMNGSITHHHTYEILQALYQVGLRREANDLFVKLTPLARSGGLSAGLHSGMDWRNPDGSPSGYEGLLAEQYQFLLAAVTGYMGWELTIDGLRLNPAVRAACSDRVQLARPNFARLAQ
ncbi:MAG: glucosidase family protein, partial [Anaerolineae bacterium]